MKKINVLFVGEMQSSHAQSWADLVSEDPVFETAAVPLAFEHNISLPMPQYSCRNIPQAKLLAEAAGLRQPHERLYSLLALNPFFIPYPPTRIATDLAVLSYAIQDFSPDVVHTFGFTPSALIFNLLPFTLKSRCKWILQTRGGSDTAFHRSDAWIECFREILPQAAAVICDNEGNFSFFAKVGAEARRHPVLSIAPGTGGITPEMFAPVTELEKREPRLIFSKAYESQWSKGLPVFEGIVKSMELLPHITATVIPDSIDIQNALHLLPAKIKERITVLGGMPRHEFTKLMGQAQVAVMPSLVDGVPNTLYEAFAAGVIPVVSPLDTITPFFEEGKNVFFARNLYPDEVSLAIVKAFTDRTRNAIIKNNLKKFEEFANRNMISSKVCKLYKAVSAEQHEPAPCAVHDRATDGDNDFFSLCDSYLIQQEYRPAVAFLMSHQVDILEAKEKIDNINSMIGYLLEKEQKTGSINSTIMNGYRNIHNLMVRIWVRLWELLTHWKKRGQD